MSAVSTLNLNESEQGALEDLLIDQMDQSADLKANKRLRSTRFVATRFANRCLPFNSVKARWVNVLGLGATNDRAEVQEEAQRGLSPYWHRMINATTSLAVGKEDAFPAFQAVMEQFFSTGISRHSADPMKLVSSIQQSFPSCFSEMTAFSRRILFHEAMQQSGNAVAIDSEWERRLDVAVEKDEKVREQIKRSVQCQTSCLRRISMYVDVTRISTDSLLLLVTCEIYRSTMLHQ